jgi:opacity protein-like surface antigen
MQVKNIVLVAAMTAIWSAAWAGAFDGPYAQAGIGFANSHTRLSAPAWFDSTPGNRGTIGQIGAGYSHSFGKLNLAASVHYILGDQKAGKIDYSTSGAGTMQFRNRNAWGLAIEPGVNIGESTLVYAKLGYAASNGRGSDNWTIGGVGHSSAYDQTFRGYSYGAGAKFKLGPSLYGLVELQQANYRNRTWSYANGYQTTVKPNSLTGIVGLGYLF